MIHSQPFSQNEWGMKKPYGNLNSCNHVKKYWKADSPQERNSLLLQIIELTSLWQVYSSSI